MKRMVVDVILTDYSQILVSNAMAFAADFQKGTGAEKKQEDILRHSILTTLLSYKTQYGKKFGDILIACDGRNYWRKEVFPQYKQHRKGDREESKIDWSAIFNIGSKLLEEFKTTFPYRIIQVDRAEGDDVIAILTKHLSEVDKTETEFMSESSPIIIISSDGDFKQLHTYKNVKQWNPIMKKLVAKPDKYFLLEKIIRGDKGDGIPSILCDDDFLITKLTRAPAITKAIISKFLSGNDLSQINSQRFLRNRMLIDFDYIPTDVATDIIEQFNTVPVIKDKGKILNYLIAHRCRMLMEQIQNF